MAKQTRLSTVAALAALALALGSAACTLNPNIPNARVLCDPDAPKCPSGYRCEKVEASVTIGVCCRTAGCAAGLTPDQIGDIVDAAVSSGRFDAGADGSTCAVDETCTDNPGGPCLEGRIECGSNSRVCKDGPKARDGTPCGSNTNMLCINGTCSVCRAGTACATNTDQCTNGMVVCNPAGCSNGTTKSPGSTCGTGQVCSAAGTCIQCSTGAPCSTNAGGPCKKGAIACDTGAPQCTDDMNAPDGTFCGMDKVCKTGVCTTCAAGTVCPNNPGGMCKLGVIQCGSTPGCIDGDNVGPGMSCGSNLVCNGNGQCVTCEAGKACAMNPGAPCKTGVTDCTSGAPKCVDSGNTPVGTTCGTNLVCNGSGTCVPCTAGGACTDNPSICRNGVTSCQTGTAVCVDGTNKPATAMCTGGKMCDGNGFCGACVAGQSCTGNSNACKQGTTVCTGSMTSCGDGANRTPGTSCGIGMVCDGNGACVACAPGQSCTMNANVCKTGTTSCATGAPTCVDDASKPSGTTCGTDKVCNSAGACVACIASANCTDNPTPCKTGITSCATGARVCLDFGSRSPGSSCGTGMICDGNGACIACSPGQSCTGNPGSCYSGITSCTTGAQTCVDGPIKSAGTGCGTNQVCNANGQCTVCPAGQACAMNPHAACVNGVTSCMTGVQTCVDGTNKTAGTACGTNQVCNGSGTCVTCAAGTSCTGNPSPCKSGVVSCTTGASNCIDGTGNLTAGTSCGTNQVCDGNGFCGMCTEGQSCSGNPNPCTNGAASCSTGTPTCANGSPKAPGTSCGTNMVCNGSSSCIACTAGGACTMNPNPCKDGATSCSTGALTCADAGNRPPGVTCGTNMVCNGSGTCIACTAGSACTMNPNPCKNGMNSCSTGASTCVDGGNKSPGTTCGTNMVCNGSGTCVACTAGGACTTNTNICKNGVNSCATGALTCVDGSNKTDGTGCGTNMVCSAGACVACTAGGACTTNQNPCKNGVNSCATGTLTCADGSNKAGGATCGTNQVCDGNGNCGACTSGQSCATNPNPCYTGVTSCATGTMVCNNNAPKGIGVSCGTNMVCNSSNTCVACTAGMACTGNPSVCKDGTTSCSTGAQTCIDGGNKANGTGCNDNQACTRTDVCTNGVCGGTSYTCTPTMCQATSVCNGSGGCTTSNKPDTTGCDDGNACTYSDVCKSGVCIGTSYGCSPSQCQSMAVCNGSGGCLYANKPNGSGCNDGNNCSYSDTCTNGSCAGITYSCPLPGPGFNECEDVSCNGSGGCTTTDINQGATCRDCCTGGPGTCNGGVCTGGNCCNSDFCCSL